MNPPTYKWVAVATIVLGFAFVSAPIPLAAKELRYGSPLPDTTPVNKLALKPILDRIGKETDGHVSFRFFGGGQLVDSKNALTGIQNGIVDAGFIILPFISSEVPYNSLISESIGFTHDALAAAGALNEFLLVNCKECRGELAKYDAMWLGAGATDAYTIQCRTVIESLDDLKGKKIRVAGGATGRWVEKLGMVPTFLPPPDIAPAMQSGRIDCSLSPTSWLVGFSIKDAAKSVIDRPMGIGMGGGSAIKLSVWKSIPQKDRARVIATMPDLAYDETVKGFGEPAALGRKLSKEKGIKFITTLPGLEEKWAEFRVSERAELIANAQKRGIKDAPAVIDTLIATFDKWEKLAPTFANNKAAFSAALMKAAYNRDAQD